MCIDSKMIGKELKSLRSRKGKRLDEVSKYLGIHFNTLLKYEKDATDLKMGTLKKILDYYDIDELIFFKTIREYNHKKER